MKCEWLKLPLHAENEFVYDWDGDMVCHVVGVQTSFAQDCAFAKLIVERVNAGEQPPHDPPPWRDDTAGLLSGEES